MLIERKFVKPSSISDHLKCPICFDVYNDAMRLYCGHTFCNECLQSYMVAGNTCPQCRRVIDKKNIGFDLLAREIINELDVFCQSQDCPWKVCYQLTKGTVQQLSKHISECIFQNRSEKQQNMKKGEKIVWHETLDDEVMDKINEHTAKGSLEARILIKTESLRNHLITSEPSEKNAGQSVTKTGGKKRKGKRGKKQGILGENNQIQQQKQKTKTTNYDFLSSLFD